MINPILEFAVRQRLLVLLATAILIGFGILALGVPAFFYWRRANAR